MTRPVDDGSGDLASVWSPLGFALTGQWLGAPDPGLDPDLPVAAADVAAWLASQGWSAEVVAAHRRDLQQTEQPWPHPVAPEQRGGLGAAQFHALLAELRALLGVDGLSTTHRSGPVVIGPAEQRLLADRPPHHLG